MIARLRVLLPFDFHVPEGEKLGEFSKDFKGYKVTFFPPYQASVKYRELVDMVGNNPIAVMERIKPKVSPEAMKGLLMNDKPAFETNGLQICFQKEKMELEKCSEDSFILAEPKLDVMEEAMNRYLLALRAFTGAASIGRLKINDSHWKLECLDDKLSGYVFEGRKVATRVSYKGKIQACGITEEVWENVMKRLDEDRMILPWQSLMLDAQSMLEEVGPSLMLIQTALEVLIQFVLEHLSLKTAIGNEVWKWLNDREKFWKEPSLAEKFDDFLKIYSGDSLKNKSELWQAFKEIKEARNSFIHKGIASIGGREVGAEKVLELYGRGNEIIGWLEQYLPDPEHLPRLKKLTTYKFQIPFE